MKRFLLLISACTVLMFATSSCRWFQENICSVESCTEWYLDEIYEAGTKFELGKVAELSEQYITWFSELSLEDQARATEASYKWAEKNPLAKTVLDSLGDIF